MRQDKKNKDRSEWPVAAGIFIGIGLGLITGQLPGFILIGFGLGIFVTFLTTRGKKE